MPAGLDTKTLGAVFQGRPDLLTGILQAADTPARITLFNNIASFVHEKLSSNTDEPALKRRRVDISGPSGNANGVPAGLKGAGNAAAETVLLEIKEISVSIPQRKKYDLCFTKNFLYARVPGTQGPAPGIVYAWKDIEFAFYLPVPEKAQLQYNYILFPRGTALASVSRTGPTNPPDVEPLVFTVPATAPKTGTVTGPSASTASAVSDTYSSLLTWALTTHLRAAGNRIPIVSADPKVFCSAVRQPARPSERAVHVKAFRGSKDGLLFFLPAGILWGYKKPLLFLPLDRISAVSYTSVLQRTFNLLVEVDMGDGQAAEEIEFAMLDQEDYGGIDETYVRRHGLQDRSMAERRKAKRELAENAKRKGEGGENGEEEGNGLSELAKAEQEMQDEEDEEEEDYDPGSEGESEGSGASSDDDDDEDEEGEGEDDEEEED